MSQGGLWTGPAATPDRRLEALGFLYNFSLELAPNLAFVGGPHGTVDQGNERIIGPGGNATA